MQYTHLGRTGLVVSRLCLGTASLGPHASEAESHEILNVALDAGINFIDTADIYGWWEVRQPGLSEEIIGRWLTQDRSRRNQTVLASKVYFPMGDAVNDRGLSALHIRQACEDSLRRLQTDRIDLYQLHHVDRGLPQPWEYEQGITRPYGALYRPPHRRHETPWEEIWQALEVLVRQGKVLYVGSSNFAAWNIVQACERAEARRTLGLVSDQSVYNLANRAIELEILPACREYGLGQLPYSPLGAGLLSGAMKRAEAGRRTPPYESLEPGVRAQVDAHDAFCRELGVEPATLSLAWLLQNPVVTAPIIGPRRAGQVSSNLRALETRLDAAAMARLDEIWPGPGGQAPDAYAW
ncbi:MAG: aldo/keto reductase [Anaerolineaceae bacterium]|nr:aldo/keto reductase [Anaerolineaceae bacterium]